MKHIISTLTVLSLSLILLNACGKSSSSASTTTNTLSEAAPTLGITSPTATSSSSSASLKKHSGIMEAMLGFPGIKSLFQFFGYTEKNSQAATATAPTDVVPYDTAVSALAAKFTADPTTSAASVDLTAAGAKSFQASCYGPSFRENLSNDGSTTDSGTDHPSSDSGIMYATEDATKTQACAAAQLNALIGGESARFSREALELLAVMLAKANTDGKSLPAITDTPVSVTMPTMTGITISAATLDRLSDDADGNKVFKSVITGTETASGKAISITFYHTPTAADNSTFKGLMQATIPHTSTTGGTTLYRGISMIYNKGATEMDFILESAANRATASTNFFSTTTGRIDFSKSAFEEDGVRFHASVNNTTKAWVVNYSWQAGSSDGRVRSFAIKTSGNDSAATATAYFGFGGNITSLTDSNFYTAGLTGINCNWINGVTSSTHTAKVQKQTMTYNSTAGEFRPATSNISMAPSDNCNSSVAFTYSDTVSPAATKPTFLTSPTSAITNDLVATTGIAADIGTVTVPTFTLPSGT